MTRARGQTMIGLGLAVAIIGAWLGLHIWAIFFHRWVGADWGIAIAVIAAQSWLGAGMFIVAHDAIHGSLAPGNPRLNTAVGQVAVGLYAGFGLKKLAKGHLGHHRAPGTFDDPDFHPEGSSAFAAWFYNFFTHYFGWWELARITAVVALYVFVLGANPIFVGLFWGAPAIFSALQLFVFGTYLPHRPKRTAFVDDSRARSLNYPWLLSLLTCFHFGRHREHHSHPDVPWWRLPSVRLAAVSDA